MINWTVLISIFVTMILIPVAISGTTAFLGMLSKHILVREWGTKGQLYVGGLGTFLHEAGHAIGAIIFKHHITNLKLFQFRHLGISPTLGYVRHTWDTSSYYQCLGNFFIGIAPFFTCSGFLYGLHQYLIDSNYNFSVAGASFNNIGTIWLIINTDLQNIMTSLIDDITHPLMSFIFVIFVITTSVTGYAISKADWHGAKSATAEYLTFTAILTIAILIGSSLSGIFSAYVWKVTAVMIFLMLDSWIYVGIATGAVALARLIYDRYYPQLSNIHDMLHIRGKHLKP